MRNKQYVLKGLANNFVTYVKVLPSINNRAFSTTSHISHAKVYYDLAVAEIDAREFEMEVVDYYEELRKSKL